MSTPFALDASPPPLTLLRERPEGLRSTRLLRDGTGLLPVAAAAAPWAACGRHTSLWNNVCLVSSERNAVMYARGQGARSHSIVDELHR